MLVRTSITIQRSIGNVHACHYGNMQIQSKEGQIKPQSGSIRPSTRVSNHGLDSTMNLDVLRVQHYKEIRERKKEKQKYR